MASAKQIAWRKKFARMAKSGKFRKKIKGSRTLSGKRRIDDIDASFPSPKKSNPKKKKSTNVKRLEDRISELERQLTKLADIQGGGMGYAGTEYHEVLTRMKKSEHAERKQELSDELKKEMKY